VTEAEWLACDNLFSLWWFIRYRSNKRKARLYTVACCRQVWHLFIDPACRRAIEVSERYADRMASREELVQARGDAEASWSDWNAKALAGQGLSSQSTDLAFWNANGLAGQRLNPESESTNLAFAAAVRTAFNRPDPNDVAQLAQEAAKNVPDLAERQRLLFHDLSGPRLFRPVPVDHYCLAWNDGAIPKRL
jgi:hypothetical protein